VVLSERKTASLINGELIPKTHSEPDNVWHNAKMGPIMKKVGLNFRKKIKKFQANTTDSV
jgi:hypothetical protein